MRIRECAPLCLTRTPAGAGSARLGADQVAARKVLSAWGCCKIMTDQCSNAGTWVTRVLTPSTAVTTATAAPATVNPQGWPYP
jgi:hypothetical protein